MLQDDKVQSCQQAETSGVPQATMAEGLKARDLTPRQRRPVKDFVFAGHCKEEAPLVTKREPYIMG